MNGPRDEAPAVPGAFGVDEDPYTDDDSIGQGADDPLPDLEDDEAG